MVKLTSLFYVELFCYNLHWWFSNWGREIQYYLKVHLGDIIKIYFARKFRGRELNGEL